MAKPVFTLVSVRALPPRYPGGVRVLITCSCGKETDFTYEGSWGTGHAFTCEGCGTGYAFPLPDAGYGSG